MTTDDSLTNQFVVMQSIRAVQFLNRFFSGLLSHYRQSSGGIYCFVQRCRLAIDSRFSRCYRAPHIIGLTVDLRYSPNQ